jgi:hypothetical protein
LMNARRESAPALIGLARLGNGQRAVRKIERAQRSANNSPTRKPVAAMR